MKENVTISLIDQGIISAFNFALNIALLKWWSTEEFGVYSVIFAVSFMLLSLQNALINTPYSILVPASNKPALIRQTLAVANVMFIIVITLGCLFTLQLPSLDFNLTATMAITAYLVSRLLREYLRGRWASELNLMPILITDVVGILVFGLVCLLLIYVFGVNNISLSQLLWALTASHVISSLRMLQHEFTLIRQSQIAQFYSGYRPIWEQSRWSLVGVITTEIQNRGYILVVGAFFGSAIIGFIQAGRVFFGPLNVITSAWTRVAKPTLARLLGASKFAEFRKLTHIGAAGFIVFNFLFGIILWFIWPYAQQHIYGDQYQDIGFVVAQWAVINLIFHIRSSYSTAIQVENRFKELAMATIVGAIVATIVLLIVSVLNQPSWVIASVLIAEFVALVYVANLFYSYHLNTLVKA